MPFTTELVGASGGAQFTGSDYTDPAVTQPFMNFFADLFSVANAGSPPSVSDAATIRDELIKLLNIAKNGVSVQPADAGGKSVTYYMTAQMTDSLNEVLKNLQAGGLSDLPNITQAGLAAWQSIVQSGTPVTDLRFNQNLFNIFYYVTNYFGGSKVSLNAVTPGNTTADQMIAALTKTGGNVSLSPYAARSLQAMTEVDYVNEGNELINKTLTEMYEALGVTKKVLDDLATLQDLHNKLKVVSRQDNITYARADISALQFQTKYENRMSSFTSNIIPQLEGEYSPWLFPGATIVVDQIPMSANSAGADVTNVKVWVTLPADTYTIINPITQEITTFTGELKLGGEMLLPIPYTEFTPLTAALKEKLANLLAYQKPSEYIPESSTPIFNSTFASGNAWPLITKTSNLDDISAKLVAAKASLSAQVGALSAAAPASALTNPQSLYNLTKKVYADMGDVSTDAGARAWMMDNYQSLNTPDATKAGALQQAITSAITAAQSTNDEQKETVRNNLFLFEEFYKSASTVLTQLNQIMVKMGQNIAR